LKAADRGGATLAPPGAFVFYPVRGPIDGQERDRGHVGLSLGDGRIVHAWDAVRVDRVMAVPQLRLAGGWRAPRLVGWAPVERVLVGHRRRTWTDG
jgi:cell wall-associated NlpC family hydrolase